MILQFCILIFDLEAQKHLLNSANHESENNNTHHLNEHLICVFNLRVTSNFPVADR